MNYSISLGAIPQDDSHCRFLVWSPFADRVDVNVVSPRERLLPLVKGERGYFHGVLEKIEPGALYFYMLDGRKRRPDPASRFQPDGVHQASQIIDPRFFWEDESWAGLHLQDYAIYEIHPGAYTPEGTFDAVIPHLDELVELGITAVELMPVAQFPGNRNWGYDGAYPFAAQNSYGGPNGLKRLVNACHLRGLAVILDVVYNHLGPEGNYLGDFGRYFTDLHRTPWGPAINFDGPDSDEVRRYFIENALHWVREFHIDALRLDALHTIVDQSPFPFLAELAAAVHGEGARLKRLVYLMAESDLNDTRFIRSRETGGYGLDAHWNDDFHHALHTVLTGEHAGYYADFGRVDQIAKACREGFVYSGEYSRYRRRRHGSPSGNIPLSRFVVFSQNHDQIGNRLSGGRLSSMVSFEALKLAAAVVILSPSLPLIFMGEEYEETAPFLYFVSHSDPDLIEAVRKGRADEFSAFNWTGELPDPQAERTFELSKLDHELRLVGKHKVLREFYRELFRLRKRAAGPDCMQEVLCYEDDKLLLSRFRRDEQETAMVFHFGPTASTVALPLPSGTWRKTLDSAEVGWGGAGSRTPSMVSADRPVSLVLSPQSIAAFVRGEGA